MNQPKKRSFISFEQYLKRRGYVFFSIDQAIFRTIRKSFSQKSFCGFWRMWNPFTGYLVFLLYSFLGGNRKRPYLIFLVFMTSGIVFHDLVIYLITGSISIIFTITFLLYSMISLIENILLVQRKGARKNAFEARELPIAFRVIINMVLLLMPLVIGFIANFLIFPQSVMNRLFQFFLA